jgi:stage IV sporulation protein FB
VFERGSFDLGTVGGVRVRIHSSFAFLLAIVALLTAITQGPLAALATGFVIALHFGFVLLHELGHATVARLLGHPVGDITLTPLGGIARIGALGARPSHEIAIAAAGPAVNLVLAAAIALFYFLFPIELLRMLVVSNLTLALFNLLPAFPLDGGRILRAWLARRDSVVRATRRAARAGRAVAVGLGLLGIVTNPWLVLVAGFIWLAGAQEERLVERLVHDDRPRVEVVYLDPHGRSAPTFFRRFPDA